MSERCTEILRSHEKCIEYIKEVNGLVGAINCDAPEKIRELIRLYKHDEWVARNLRETIEWLIEFDYVDEATKKMLEERLQKYREKSGTDKKVFCSMAAIEREFFPNSYKKKLEEEEKKKPGAFGTGLAKEIMEEIRRRLREGNND